MPAIINSDDGVVSGSAGLKTSGANDGITAFQQNGTERMRITAAGDVGIGTSSPSYALQITRSAVASYVANTDGTGTLLSGVNGSGLGVYGTFSNTAVAFFSNSTERARITSTGDFQFNSGYGSVATAYGCRAWVNFNGTGTVAIRASGNVTSITDNGVGDYTVNFTTAMPDANYSVSGSATLSTSGASAPRIMAPFDVNTQTTGSSRVRTGDDTGTVGDMALVCVQIFR